MNTIIFFVVLAFLGTVAVLMAGGISMVIGGKFDNNHADDFMQGRLLMQAITLAIIIIAVLAWA
jgi:hypothetical protein